MLFILISCKKNSNVAIPAQEKLPKSTRLLAPATMLLIPSGSTARIGYLVDGMLPSPITSATGGAPYGSVICAVLPLFHNIYNPSLLAGLPNQISGLRLTGLARLDGGSANPRIALSYSSGANHYILLASLVGNDYLIFASIVLNSPFAAANNGWVLHDIEYSDTGFLFGVFYNQNSNTSILSSIDIATGNCTMIGGAINNTRYAGMEVFKGTIYLLLYTNGTPGNYGFIDKYTTMGTYTGSIPLNIPTTAANYADNVNWSIGSYGYDYFLGQAPGTWNLVFYNGSGSSPLSNTYYLNNVFAPAGAAIFGTNISNYVTPPNTFTPSTQNLNYIITDCTN